MGKKLQVQETAKGYTIQGEAVPWEQAHALLEKLDVYERTQPVQRPKAQLGEHLRLEKILELMLDNVRMAKLITKSTDEMALTIFNKIKQKTIEASQVFLKNI